MNQKLGSERSGFGPRPMEESFGAGPGPQRAVAR